jgi:hypothetical protein
MPLSGDAMSVENSRILAQVMAADFDSLANVQLNRTSRDGFLMAMLDYFDFHLDSVHTIRSVEILRAVFD